jgi:putative heme iron utilization protein
MKAEEFDLENLPRKNIFKVPENYFQELPSTIEQRTQSIVESLPKENIFKVPENYFEQLSSTIEQRTLSVVESLPKENIFKVPENYFETLESQILAHTTQATKIVPLITWSAKRTWASVAACSAIAILGYFTLMPKQDSLGNEALAGVQNQEIVNYLIQQDLNQTDVAEQIENKNIKFKETDLLNNLKVSENDILQSIDLEDLDEEI